MHCDPIYFNAEIREYKDLQFPREVLYDCYAYYPDEDKPYGVRKLKAYKGSTIGWNEEAEPLPESHPRYSFLQTRGRELHAAAMQEDAEEAARIQAHNTLTPDIVEKAEQIRQELQAVLDKHNVSLTLVSDTDDYFEFGIVLDGHIFPI